jgi:hypothetical protein
MIRMRTPGNQECDASNHYEINLYAYKLFQCINIFQLEEAWNREKTGFTSIRAMGNFPGV